MYNEEPFLIFGGSSSQELAQVIAKELKIPLGKANIGKYNDGEINVQIQENVQNKDIFVVQSTYRTKEATVNDSLMELFFMVRALKRASAQPVTSVIPSLDFATFLRPSSGIAPPILNLISR